MSMRTSLNQTFLNSLLFGRALRWLYNFVTMLLTFGASIILYLFYK